MSNILPLPLPFLRSTASFEPSDDKEVEDGEHLGVPLGEADIELDEDDGEESMGAVSRRGLRAVTVDAIAAGWSICFVGIRDDSQDVGR